MGRTFVLAHVFRPGIHEEHLYVTVWTFEVPKDSPLVCAVATTNAFIFVDCLKKPCLMLWLDIVFDCDKSRARIGDSRVFIRHDGQLPVDPRREVDRQVRQLEQQPQCCGGDGSGTGPNQRHMNASPGRQRTPYSTSTCHRSLKHEQPDGKYSSAYPVGSMVQSDHIEERDENNPCRACNEHGCVQCRQIMKHARGHRAESKNQNSPRHHRFGRPPGPGPLHCQGTQHSAETERTEQESIARWTFADFVRNRGQQRKKSAGEKHNYPRTKKQRAKTR